MSVNLKTLSFNSGRQEAMVAFFDALGAGMTAKQVSVGSQSFQGRLNSLEIVIYGIPKKENPTTPSLSLRFEVTQIIPIMEKLKALSGVQVLMDIEMMPDGKKAIVKDPDGHSVELIELWAGTGQG